MTGSVARQFRKPKKRPSREHQDALAADVRDADLSELWDVLAEIKQTNSWTIPWIDGVNAIELAMQLVRVTTSGKPLKSQSREETAVIDFVLDWIAARQKEDDKNPASQEDYWQFQEYLSMLDGRTHYACDHFLRVAVRCAQLEIADSSGGGNGFNTQFDRVRQHFPQEAERLIRAARCKDALGFSAEFDQNPERDRRRRAFYTAWDRSLYQVAYAVGG